MLVFVVILSMMSVLIAGCGTKTESGDSAQTQSQEVSSAQTQASSAIDLTLKPYNIKWFLMNSVQNDKAAVEEEINKITKEKINATVELNFIDWGSYDEKMRIALASGDEMDMMFTSNFTNDYISNVSKGAFKEITMEQLNKLAPNMMSAVPKVTWEATKVNGKIYGMMIMRPLANTPGILLQKKYVDKYKFDLSTVKSFSDLTPLYEQIVKNDPGIYPIDINGGNGFYAFSLNSIGLEIVSSTNPGGIVIGEKDPKFVNLFETQQMKDILNLFRDWYKKGIIRSDASTVTDTTAEKSAQKLASILCTSNPDTLANQSNLFNLKPANMTIVEMTKPYMSTGTVLGGLTAISRTSRDPERCIMLYDLLYDQKDIRLTNLINFGIENKHYTKVNETTIKRIDQSGYWVAAGWEFGNMFNCYKENPDQPDWYPAGPDKNASAVVSEIFGFSFNPEPVKSELAQCQSVFEEYMPALFTGSVEVDGYLNAFLSKLDKAGSKKIIDEMNTQLDKWKASI
jgi:putative aldouronate transport system substrate-binding protein